MSEQPIRLNTVTRKVLASGRLAHLATINPDGTPQVTCIYIGWDGDELVAGHFANHVNLGTCDVTHESRCRWNRMRRLWAKSRDSVRTLL